MEHWWSNFLHALIQSKIFLMIGRRLVPSCKLFLKVVSLSYTHVWNRFLYALYITIDGNLKLKGKQCYLKDIELMPRWRAYVLEQEYQSHIADHVEEVEVRVCDVMRSSPKCWLNEYLNRLMHVKCSTMLSSAWVPVWPLVMPFQVPLWWFVQSIAWYRRMGLGTFSSAKSVYHIFYYLFSNLTDV